MRPEFYAIYENMYKEFEYYRPDRFLYSMPEDFLSPREMRRLAYETREAIERVDNDPDIPGNLRADAKYFLLLNFYEMVLLPIATVREMEDNGQIRENFTPERMREDLQHDIRLIVQEAERIRAETIEERRGEEREEREDENRREITGHNIIDAIGGVWDKIRYNEYLYWASR